MEGKPLAIDSSIWLYQFQATMRDKEGRGLHNAHVLGFLRRICKLLFYGIKPVFVFDGGAPALKRSTIAERKRRKAGAAQSHARVAERLLAAHLRREALNHAQAQGATKPGETKLGILDENTVYFEDLDRPPVTPRKSDKAKGKGPESTPSSSKKRSKWADHDPYKLPDIDMDAVIAAATSTADDDGVTKGPDPRLATEEELRQFIETMRPEDFDESSPAFRELPTELQYEIIGNLRLKSRQTSHARLQQMLSTSKTALDFSKAQIRGLYSRNNLTQQLLNTVDNMGKTVVDHHVRIVAERGKEYVLVKNEGPTGGWTLAFKDQGTKEKPIQVEPDSDDDDDMEEVLSADEAPTQSVGEVLPDMRAFQRSMALSTIGNRQVELPPLPEVPKEPEPLEPLFNELYEIDSDHLDDDIPLVLALKASIDQQAQEDEEVLRRALEASKAPWDPFQTQGAGPSNRRPPKPRMVETSLEQTQNSEPLISNINYADIGDLYAKGPSTLVPLERDPKPSLSLEPQLEPLHVPEESRFQLNTSILPLSLPAKQSDATKVVPQAKLAHTTVSVAPSLSRNASTLHEPIEVSVSAGIKRPKSEVSQISHEDEDDDMVEVPLGDDQNAEPVDINFVPPLDLKRKHSEAELSAKSYVQSEAPEAGAGAASGREEDDDSEGILSDWSRSPSPSAGPPIPTSTKDKLDWDPAQEIDVEAEEGEFAEFLSQVKGKDLITVREEIDAEIRQLNKEKKNAQRDSEEMNQQMVAQIMLLLRLFGIPYITAPMEAEAQCAALVDLRLCEGVITDDSDVFLFGGLRVFKNMFNQSKTVECFLTNDLQRELSLDRDKLIRLAYLLGSDYVGGLPGVGPVVAMELLKEFPGDEGLHRFKDWWLRVQSGKDRPEDVATSFRRRFKKRFKTLHLTSDWPNPAVRDAYYHPVVDESDEPFNWGLPDLDGLRSFLNEELGWSQTKTDELLLPIIKKMGQRKTNSNIGRQGVLDKYFDTSIVGGVYAPRKRQAYASKRLQQVVSDFRKGVADEPAKSKEGTPAVDEAPGSRGGRKRARGPAKVIAAPRKKRKLRSPSPADEEMESEDDGAGSGAVPDRPLNVSLRPRRKASAAVVDEEAK